MRGRTATVECYAVESTGWLFARWPTPAPRNALWAAVVPTVNETSCARPAAQIRQAIDLVRAAVGGAGAEPLTVEEAREMAVLLGQLSKLVGASVVRYASEAGRDAVHVLAGARGTMDGKARTELSLLERMSSVPEVAGAFRDGALSIDQAAIITSVARVVPGAAADLLEAARSAPVRQLKLEAARAVQRARGERAAVAAERSLHASRFCKFSFPEGGGVRLEALFGSVQGARVKSALERATQLLFEETRALGVRGETFEHLRADALARLVCGKGTGAGGGDGVAAGAGGTGARGGGGASGTGGGTGAADTRPARWRSEGGRAPEILVRVDAAALRRGEVQAGEVCEIAGVGPVSVAAARELLGEGFFTLLVDDGVDIRTVTSTKRAIPRRVTKALLLRDAACVVPECPETEQLEIDHWGLDYSWGGPTAIDNLCRLCHVHHKMKTEQGWRLAGGPGRWEWLPPRTVEELVAERSRGGRGVSRRPAPGSPKEVRRPEGRQGRSPPR